MIYIPQKDKITASLFLMRRGLL